MSLFEDRITIIDGRNPIEQKRSICRFTNFRETLDGDKLLDGARGIGGFARTPQESQGFVSGEFFCIGNGTRRLAGSRCDTCLLISDISNPPDATAGTIAIGVFQGDFVVSDDFVIEVCDVKASIGSKLQIDGAEPRVVAGEQIGHFDSFGRGTEVFETVAIDAASHDVAAKKIGLEARRECFVIHVGDT